MIQDYLLPDEMWSAIQGAFSPEEAIYFRNYPIRVDNTIREIDYFVLHRTGVLLLVIADFMEGNDNDAVVSADGTVRFKDALTNETRTWHPLAMAERFIATLKNLNIDKVVEYRVIIWLPNIATNMPKQNIFDNLHYQFISKVSPDFIQSFMSSDIKLLDSTTWDAIVSRMNPPSPIQTRLTEPNQRELFADARNLSQDYIAKSSKQTPIFISYRRDDAGWAAGRFYGDLKRIFAGEIFFDYDSIKPGALWEDAIDQALDACIVQLIIIGKQWATIKRERKAPFTRIMEKDDMVRHEIQVALRKKVMVIPILIDHQQMPTIQQLPNGLKQLPTRNAMLFTQNTYFANLDVLVKRITGLLQLASPPTTPKTASSPKTPKTP